MNYIHYDTIIDFHGGKGIQNFEPTKYDIEKLVKKNKTSRGCVWAGEDGCD